MSLAQFLSTQLVDVIQWNEPQDNVLAYRYPMLDKEIETGSQLTVRESEMAAFVNEGVITDIFGPGLHKLSTHNLPILTKIFSWDTGFVSPFKSDVYFFSTHLQIDQKWGTATPITIRDKEFGAVRLRAYGIYSYRIADPRVFFRQISGTHQSFFVSDLEGQLRDSIIAQMSQSIAASEISFLDLTGEESALAAQISDALKPSFSAMGLELTQFAVESISLPDELQQQLDKRISMNMVGDVDKYAKFIATQAMTIAAANPGGAAGLGMSLGVGASLAQSMVASLKPAADAPTAAADAKYCTGCGHALPPRAIFCPDCGTKQ